MDDWTVEVNDRSAFRGSDRFLAQRGPGQQVANPVVEFRVLMQPYRGGVAQRERDAAPAQRRAEVGKRNMFGSKRRL